MSKKKKRRNAPQKKKRQSAQSGNIQKNGSGETRKNWKKQTSLRESKHPNWLLAGLAAAGMILAAYLVLTGWLHQEPVLCAEGSSCDIVQQSRWGAFLGLPIAFWGFLNYSALFFIGLGVRNPRYHWKSAWAVSMISMGYSTYLILIAVMVIQATCAYCIASFVIMTAIFGVVTFQRPKKSEKFNFLTFAGEITAITAVIVLGMHLHYSGVFDPTAGPEDPFLKGLAEHLTEDRALLYGASW